MISIPWDNGTALDVWLGFLCVLSLVIPPTTDWEDPSSADVIHIGLTGSFHRRSISLHHLSLLSQHLGFDGRFDFSRDCQSSATFDQVQVSGLGRL
jgi:hypothetical protein